MLTIDKGFAERYVFFLFESDTKRCSCTFYNGVALFERVFINGLSKKTLRILGPFDFLIGAYCFLDKKLYPKGYDILSASAKA